jgi:hypothetical protein
MGSIAMCNCNKGSDEDQLDLEKSKQGDSLLNDQDYPGGPCLKENGIIIKIPESGDRKKSAQHNKTLSNEYGVEIKDDK